MKKKTSILDKMIVWALGTGATAHRSYYYAKYGLKFSHTFYFYSQKWLDKKKNNEISFIHNKKWWTERKPTNDVTEYWHIVKFPSPIFFLLSLSLPFSRFIHRKNGRIAILKHYTFDYMEKRLEFLYPNELFFSSLKWQNKLSNG